MGFCYSLSCNADHFAASICQADTLTNGSINIVSVGIGHGLYPDGILPAKSQIADVYNA